MRKDCFRPKGRGGFSESGNPPGRLTPQLVVVGAAAALPTAVATLTEVGLVIYSWAHFTKLEAKKHSETKVIPAETPALHLHRKRAHNPIRESSLAQRALWGGRHSGAEWGVKNLKGHHFTTEESGRRDAKEADPRVFLVKDRSSSQTETALLTNPLHSPTGSFWRDLGHPRKVEEQRESRRIAGLPPALIQIASSKEGAGEVGRQ